MFLQRISFLLTVLVVLGIGSATQAAPPPKNKEEADETRFVLSVLEDFYRTTWPEADAVGDARTVKRFVARQEQILAELKARVKEANLGTTQSRELIELLDTYKVVLQRGDKHTARLDEFEDGMKKKWLQIYSNVSKEAAAQRMESTARVTYNASDYLSRPNSDPFIGLFGMLASGMAESAKIENSVRLKASKEWQDYLVRAKPEYEKNVAKLTETLVDEVRNDLAAQRKTAEALAEKLAEKYGWAKGEYPFAPLVPGQDRGDDPLFKARTIAVEVIDRSKGDDAEAAQHLDRAKKYVAAAESIPQDKAYNFFRAACYAEAGKEANRAAALEVGAKGFSIRKPGESAELALLAWDRYIVNEKRDIASDGAILYQRALANAYGGKCLKSYVIAKKNVQFWPADPTFYYDLSRICCVAAEDAAKGTKAQRDFATSNNLTPAFLLRESAVALDQAVRLGFKDFARAGETPDLGSLRGADAQLFRGIKNYQQIVGGR